MTAHEPYVVCVIVTRHRAALLERCLSAVARQSRRPDRVVVVDNGCEAETATVTSRCGLPHTYLPSRLNLGGAGGFAYGILAALAMGADWVWLADDDGRPGHRRTLERLLWCAGDQRLGAVSPLVVDARQPERLAFPLRRGLTWLRRVDEVGGAEFIPGLANLFNGALFSAAALQQVGVPDMRLFVRGDEVEIHRRLRRSGVRFGTWTPALYEHPSGQEDWLDLWGGLASVLVPSDASRRDTTFRNLGYLTSQPGLRWRRLPDELRYAWHYLAVRGDVAGFARWRRLASEGRGERFPARVETRFTAPSPPSLSRRAGVVPAPRREGFASPVPVGVAASDSPRWAELGSPGRSRRSYLAPPDSSR
ncbi:MAG TPA: glycosyltransferase [Intrasporangium sp.]|nr:glycosyltransferase [Intrasporangium sp.]